MCKSCKMELHIDLFMLKKDKGKYYYMGKCKSCYSEQRKPSAVRHRKKLIPSNKEERSKFYKDIYNTYRETHKRRYESLKSSPEFKQKRSNSGKEYYINNKEAHKKYGKEYQSRPEVVEKRKEIHRIRSKSDKEYVIKRRLRFRLRHIIDALGSKNYKYISSSRLLGCTIGEFEKHIESLFENGMSWDYIFNGAINIDHKIPCAKFDLTDISQQVECFHYTNLQPMWQTDNYKKGAVYNGVNYRLSKNKL